MPRRHGLGDQAGITAKQALDRLNKPDPMFGVIGIAMPNADPDTWKDYGVPTALQGDLLEGASDGRLIGWGFARAAESHEAYTIIFSSMQQRGGGPQVQPTAQHAPALFDVPGHQAIDPHGPWIDSDEAIRTIVAEQPRVRLLLSAQAADLIMVLHHLEHREHPQWAIRLTPHDGDPLLMFTLDAVTGTPLGLEEAYPERESVIEKRTISLNHEQEHSFEAPRPPYSMVSAQVDSQDNLSSLSSVDAWLHTPGPDGGQHPMEGEWPDALWISHREQYGGEYTIKVSASFAGFMMGGIPDDALPKARITICFDGSRPDPLGLHPRGACL